MPGEFSLTNYFLFIGKKSCSGDKLLTNRKRRFCWELVLILAALRSLILFSLPPLLTRPPPTPPPHRFSFCGFIDPSSALSCPPPHPPGFSPIPFLVSFSSKSPGRQQGHPSLLVNQRKLTCVISGPERQLAREAPLVFFRFCFSLVPFLPSLAVTQAEEGIFLGLIHPGSESPEVTMIPHPQRRP